MRSAAERCVTAAGGRSYWISARRARTVHVSAWSMQSIASDDPVARELVLQRSQADPERLRRTRAVTAFLCERPANEVRLEGVHRGPERRVPRDRRAAREAAVRQRRRAIEDRRREVVRPRLAPVVAAAALGEDDEA